MHDQAERLRQILEQKKNVKEAKTIAVLSGKGGVGKSNFALNFAIGLASRGKKVLLFDLDFGMGNIDVLLGLAPKKTIVNLFLDESITLREIMEEGPNQISYVAAGSGLTEIFEMDESKFDYFLKQLSEVSYQYDYIIFDLGAGIQKQHLYFALSAHENIIVTTTEPTSLTDAYAVVKHLMNEQPNLHLYVLINRAMSEIDGKETFERLHKVVKRFLQQDVTALGILLDDRSVVEAVKAQIPFLLKNDKSVISRNLNYIIDNYLNHGDEGSKRDKHSFVTKLKMMFSKKGRLR